MKKLFVILLAAVMVLTLAALVSCNNGKEEATETNETATTVADAKEDATQAAEAATTATEEATTAAEEATEAATKAAGRSEDEEQVYLFDTVDTAGHSAVAVSKKAKGTGFMATIPEGKWVNGVSFCCPSYSDDFGSLTVYIYKFDTDIKTTLAGTELYKETFEDFGDNTWIEVYFFDAEFAHTLTNGDYVFVIKEGIDELGSGVGVWTDYKLSDDSMEPGLEYNVQYINNGKLQEKSKVMVDAILTLGFYTD